jgi:hypothetical protein
MGRPRASLTWAANTDTRSTMQATLCLHFGTPWDGFNTTNIMYFPHVYSSIRSVYGVFIFFSYCVYLKVCAVKMTGDVVVCTDICNPSSCGFTYLSQQDHTFSISTQLLTPSSPPPS